MIFTDELEINWTSKLISCEELFNLKIYLNTFLDNSHVIVLQSLKTFYQATQKWIALTIEKSKICLVKNKISKE